MKKKKTILLISGLILLSILLGISCTTQINDSRLQARLICNSNDLKNLGLLIFQYNHDKGNYPTDLSVLYGDYCVTPQYFVCQGITDTPLPKSSQDIKNGACDYFYFGKGYTRKEYPEDLPILVTKPGILPDKIIFLLFKNGRVNKTTTDNLDKNILKLIKKKEKQK